MSNVGLISKLIDKEEASQEQPTVTKLEYIYGINEISIRHKTSVPASVSVSKPITVDGNIIQVRLYTDEEHPVIDTSNAGEAIMSDRCTSIEYYITHTEIPNQDQWYPILPTGQSSIRNELLFFINEEATLRFPALIAEGIDTHIYCDGIRIDDSEWEYGPMGGSVKVKNRKPMADYTIDYTPDGNAVDPYLIDFQAKGIKPVRYVGEDGREGEVFNGANHNCSVKLSHTPYIRRGVINNSLNYDANTSDYKPILVYLEDGNIAVPGNRTITSINPFNSATPTGVCTKNMTDYINNTTPILKPYNMKINTTTGLPENLAFEYYQKGNRLYFTETFNNSSNIANMDINHGDAKIRVVYEYLVSSMRVKIILRRTGKFDYSALSPILRKYTLEILTIK